jgi:hypothetical protein
MVWAPMASNIYHDLMWYPHVGQSRISLVHAHRVGHPLQKILMAMDHNPSGRRPHYHRGRRGTDRRGNERRSPQAPEQSARPAGDQTDVEQIMREIRARIPSATALSCRPSRSRSGRSPSRSDPRSARDQPDAVRSASQGSRDATRSTASKRRHRVLDYRRRNLRRRGGGAVLPPLFNRS